MKKTLKLLIMTLVFMGICVTANIVYGADASISASKKEIYVGESTAITASISATETWSLKMTTTGGNLSGDVNNGDAYGKEESKSVLSANFSATSAGNYTITLSGKVAGSDLKSKSISKTVAITVKEKATTNNNSGSNSNNNNNNNSNNNSNNNNNSNDNKGSSSNENLPAETKPSTVTNTQTPTKSQDNSLKSLSVDVGTLTPAFSPRVTKYTVDVGEEVTNIEISATKNHSKASVSGTGTKELNPGVNTFDIVVTAEDGKTQTYTITVNKPEEKKEEELKLLSLVVKGITTDRELVDLIFDSEFSEDVYTYNLDVESNIESLTIDAVPKQEGTIVEISGNEDLVAGENIINIIVKSENGELTATYELIVNKEDEVKAASSTVELPHSVEIPETFINKYSIPMIVFTCIIAGLGLIFAIVEYRYGKKQKDTILDKNIDIKDVENIDSLKTEETEEKPEEKQVDNNIREEEKNKKGKGKHF